MNQPHSSLLNSALWPICPLMLAVSATADESKPASIWFRDRREQAWLQNYDPTLFSRRVFSEFTYKLRTSFAWYC